MHGLVLSWCQKVADLIKQIDFTGEEVLSYGSYRIFSYPVMNFLFLKDYAKKLKLSGQIYWDESGLTDEGQWADTR